MDLATIKHPEAETGTAAEASVLRLLREEGDSLLLRYLDENTADESTYVGRDAAKRLFPPYRENPTLHNRDCDRAASALADAARRTVLAREVDPLRSRVIILTGCPASGKTINAEGEQAHAVEMVHETIFPSCDRARRLVTDAAGAKRIPVVHLFYTDDPRINVRRMLLRAQQIGRTVPISYMARTYVEVPKIVAKLEAEFAGVLTVRVTNNSEVQRLAITHNKVERALYHTQRYTLESCLEEMYDELDRAHRRDDLSSAIFSEAAR